MQTALAIEYEKQRGKPLPSKNHGIVQSNLIIALGPFRDEFTIVSELSLELEGRPLVPDISVFPKLPVDWHNDEATLTDPHPPLAGSHDRLAAMASLISAIPLPGMAPSCKPKPCVAILRKSGERASTGICFNPSSICFMTGSSSTVPAASTESFNAARKASDRLKF